MKIAILGATGFVGQAVLEQALAAGYDVKALVRTPEKLKTSAGNLEVVQGTLENAEKVAETLEGCVAVVSAAGGVKGSDQYKAFETITHILVSEMKKAGIKKLVSINGSGTILPNEYVGFKRKALSTIVGIFLKHMKDAKIAEMDILLKEKEIDWISVRANLILKKPLVGHVLADDQKMPGGSITLPDLAKFMVDQVNSDTWVHKAPFVSIA
ncbi:NAD(P)-dependent oxidoreductase [Marinomonas mediterranea]|jgi:Putative NADH-flavin reductase|uniref:NADP oxidoreductase coenzyme F420-dependent n=1 Tax=Marinomonas mediterranea (strain ATCC 700492 / JCM 21426 / NBRC 103028 / MMB-1) TaxID=717774 RepID=F2JV43_MARM1|nr:NAD(P)H-binding protein [Marinomonas mediterranea]ADZ92801.1 NADP oxidoreductase coenzyme F420-dependent [Marinomonas mediterranea MMB-1]WCN10734.1 NAD(P)H-binding protein [Marinomonas mediterranea]WCN14790.1 NAD(P)H-binding protein [Marinomonas mediterranea]WCN18824.1 NAD(P)H-binding protein [Marinomonas mediterranea MMB-1]